jgi:hypothetical protein
MKMEGSPVADIYEECQGEWVRSKGADLQLDMAREL